MGGRGRNRSRGGESTGGEFRCTVEVGGGELAVRRSAKAEEESRGEIESMDSECESEEGCEDGGEREAFEEAKGTEEATENAVDEVEVLYRISESPIEDHILAGPYSEGKS